MALILHCDSGNKNAFKARIAAEYCGVKVLLAKNFEMGVSNKTPEFIKMNPLGKVPVLDTPDGAISGGNAIARCVARSKGDNLLFGDSLIQYGRVEQWIDFATTEIDSNIVRWLHPRIGLLPHVPASEEISIHLLKTSLEALNTYLASTTFLVGHSVTLADIVMTCNLYSGFAWILNKDFTSEFPHVERYFWTMVNQPNFKKIIGDVKQAKAVPAIRIYAAPAKPKEVKKEAQKQAKKEALKKVKKEAPKQAKKEAPKQAKKEAPKETPKLVVEAADEDAPKPKPPNPLDILPPSKMVLDDWKRLYSNTKSNFHEVAVKGFWNMYDPEGYSLWFCEYKYQEENTVSYVTMNKVGGFLQRMDLYRKYAFGKMLVVGSEAPFKLKGLWLFRGQEIPQFVMDEVYDMELYEWTKVDISDQAQKERVNAMIEDLEPFEGQALLDAKCFK